MGDGERCGRIEDMSIEVENNLILDFILPCTNQEDFLETKSPSTCSNNKLKHIVRKEFQIPAIKHKLHRLENCQEILVCFLYEKHASKTNHHFQKMKELAHQLGLKYLLTPEYKAIKSQNLGLMCFSEENPTQEIIFKEEGEKNSEETLSTITEYNKTKLKNYQKKYSSEESARELMQLAIAVPELFIGKYENTPFTFSIEDGKIRRIVKSMTPRKGSQPYHNLLELIIHQNKTDRVVMLEEAKKHLNIDDFNYIKKELELFYKLNP